LNQSRDEHFGRSDMGYQNMFVYDWDQAGIHIKFATGEHGELIPEISLASEKRRVSLGDLTDFCIDILDIVAWRINGELAQTDKRVPRRQPPKQPRLRGATITFEN
jgi:hypothetical protein